jgi:hypothetical protein
MSMSTQRAAAICLPIADYAHREEGAEGVDNRVLGRLPHAVHDFEAHACRKVSLFRTSALYRTTTVMMQEGRHWRR